ncbi:unnamed protein product [Chrysoparadoxa australica]
MDEQKDDDQVNLAQDLQLSRSSPALRETLWQHWGRYNGCDGVWVKALCRGLGLGEGGNNQLDLTWWAFGVSPAAPLTTTHLVQVCHVMFVTLPVRDPLPAHQPPLFPTLPIGNVLTLTQQDLLREQDRFLPIANISRIMKKSLPDNAKIAKDAKECVQECVSEFICFITSEASDKCQTEKRKTINGEDILWAMSTLGFDKYVDPLKLYLSKYRESVKGEKPDKKGKHSEPAHAHPPAGAVAYTPHQPR